MSRNTCRNENKVFKNALKERERGKNRMTTILEAIPEVMIIFGFMLLLCAVAAIGEGIRFAVFAIRYLMKERFK